MTDRQTAGEPDCWNCPHKHYDESYDGETETVWTICGLADDRCLPEGTTPGWCPLRRENIPVETRMLEMHLLTVEAIQNLERSTGDYLFSDHVKVTIGYTRDNYWEGSIRPSYMIIGASGYGMRHCFHADSLPDLLAKMETYVDKTLESSKNGKVPCVT